jgi:hypothetical protein
LTVIPPALLEIECESALHDFIYHLKMEIWINENKTLYKMITDNVFQNAPTSNEPTLFTNFVNIHKFYKLYKACLKIKNVSLK